MKKLAFAALGVAGAMIASTAMADGHGNPPGSGQEKGFVQCGVSQKPSGLLERGDAGGGPVSTSTCAACCGWCWRRQRCRSPRFPPSSVSPRWLRVKSTSCGNTTWTMTRDTQLGLNFAGVNYYDGQGMMVPTALGVTSTWPNWTVRTSAPTPFLPS